MGEGSGCVLLVEDDANLRDVLARHLRRMGFAVAEAASVEEVAGLVAAGLRPSLVVLDVNLPGDTGWGLLRSPLLVEAGSPPVVVATAMTVDPRRLAEFHVAGYLPKPFPIDTLVDTVERLLEMEGVPESHD